MVKGFWENLQKPFFGLSPMDGVTDASFRYITAKYGHPDVIYTEFTSVEGIRAGAERLLVDLAYAEIERPAVAQLFGSDPEAFYLGAATAAALGYDGVDINMGCPAKNITQKGSGGALMLKPQRARQIIEAAKAGIEAWVNGTTLTEMGVPENIVNEVKVIALTQGRPRQNLPVSVKTRIGYDKDVAEAWVEELLVAQPAAICLHGRTLKQGYTGSVDWQAIARAAKIIKQTDCLVIGNGDVKSREQGMQYCQEYGLDGILFGRAALGNPWIFQDYEVGLPVRMTVALEQAEYLHKNFPRSNFLKIRKHFLDYCKGEEGAKQLRINLMRVSSYSEAKELLEPVLAEWSGLPREVQV